MPSDVQGERGFSHRWSCPNHHKIPRPHPGDDAVDLDQPGVDHHRAPRTISVLGLAHRHARGRSDQFGGPLDGGLGNLVETLLGIVQDGAGRPADLALGGVGNRVLRGLDDLAAPRQVGNLPGIVGGTDDRHHPGDQRREVFCSAHCGQRAVAFERQFERDRIGDLTSLDENPDRGKDSSVHRVPEILVANQLGHGLIGAVVDEDRPQEALLRFPVVESGKRILGEVGQLAQRRDAGYSPAFHRLTRPAGD